MSRRKRMLDHLEQDIRDHIERETEDGIDRGLTPEEARYAALRKFGNVTRVREDTREAWRVAWFEQLAQDISVGVRTLLKTPGFTATAVLTLALGIGLNTAVFTIVNAVLLQPPPFPEASRLFLISYGPTNNPFIPSGKIMADRDYLDFRRQDRVFQNLATFSKEPITLTGVGDPVVLNALTVTADFLKVLGVHPAIGRDFLPIGESIANFALLSDSLWHNRFGGDTKIVGKAITLDDVSYTVSGVMPATFGFQDAQLWTRMEVRLDPRRSSVGPVIGRLRPGVLPQQAEAELQTFAARRPPREPTNRDHFGAGLLPLRELFVADVRKLLLVFTGAVSFVFLIACANFANLLLIRGASRRQEIAVRAALGASRGRLLRQLLTESTLLSLAGGALGALFSVAGVRALLALLPPGKIPLLGDVHLDGWVLAFTLGLSLITGIVFGLVPSLKGTRRELRQAVSEGGRSVSPIHERLRGVLVTAEIALTLVLLTGAGLLVRSLLYMQSVNPGFRPANLLVATVDLPDSRYRTAVQMRALDDRVLADLSSLPGAATVAAVNWIPFRPEFVWGDFQLEDGRHLPHGFLVDKPVVSSGYFRAMGIRLLSGREFTERDDAASRPVAVISESVARRLWPAGNAIGKRISMEYDPKPADWLTIVGIVNDVRQQSLAETPSAMVYQPYRQVNHPFFLSHVSFVIQRRENSTTMSAQVRAVLHKADPELPTQCITSMDAMIADSTTAARSQTQLLGIFSTLSLLLAAIGIYGVLACSVAERTREIGIRMALGAEAQDILLMVFRRTLLLAGSGVLVGVLGALALTRVLTKFLFEVSSTDPITFLAVTGTLLTVALLSASIPAARAARVHPLVALRQQ